MTARRLRDVPGFAAFWTASTISGFGSAVTALAVQVLVVVTLHEGSTGVGLVNAARWLPYLLFGLVAGVLVDRVRRRPLLIGTDLGRAVLLVAIPLLALTGHLTLVLLMAFLAVFGLLSLLNDAADQSWVPSLVPPGLIVRANARLDQSAAVAQTAGPALAGGLVSLVTAPVAVLVDAASFAVSAVLLMRIPSVEPPSRPLSTRGVGTEALEGLRWVYRHPVLTPYTLATHAWFVCSAAGGAVLVPFALLTLGLNAFGLGVALAVGGVGALVGSLLATRLGLRFGVGPVVVACIGGTAVAWGVMASSPASWLGWCVFGLGQLLLGATMGAQNANEMGYWQSVTPDHLQGRSNATRRSFNRAMIVVGAPLGGALGDVLGFRPVLGAAAVGFALVALALGISPYRTARMTES
ncbi:MFS transporter [uncultured Friedmanniella sp.]|uniref:MFS transporter n=1 Tax=uncultured Friedmanniella sp. TaxID=335381 RepID=UPI0035C97A82